MSVADKTTGGAELGGGSCHRVTAPWAVPTAKYWSSWLKASAVTAPSWGVGGYFKKSW